MKWLNDIGLAILRIGGGLGMATHGYPKVFGGIEGFTGAVESMGFPFPLFFAWAAALSEFVGGILLALGVFTRTCAVLICGTMFVAAFIRHGGDPFSRKELAILYLIVTLALAIMGGGRLAVEQLWKK